MLIWKKLTQIEVIIRVASHKKINMLKNNQHFGFVCIFILYVYFHQIPLKYFFHRNKKLKTAIIHNFRSQHLSLGDLVWPDIAKYANNAKIWKQAKSYEQNKNDMCITRIVHVAYKICLYYLHYYSWGASQFVHFCTYSLSVLKNK